MVNRTLLYQPLPEVFPATSYVQAQHSTLSVDSYKNLYQESLENSDVFWAEQAKTLKWFKEWDSVNSSDFSKGHIEWYKGGKINISVNCLDRHLSSRGDKIALIWQGDDPNQTNSITYKELHRQVCRFANVLKKYNVCKGDRVVIYMPMTLEAAIAMLACSRIGAVHSVVFGGFSSEALHHRIIDCSPKVVITADGGFRRGKVIPLKEQCDHAVQNTQIEHVIVTRYAKNPIVENPCDLFWEKEMSAADISDACEPEIMDAEDPFFILYTSGSTGKPKGILHTTAGYLLYASITHRLVFDCREDDIYWCTADIGWITGHSYVVYGPLANGATSLMFEGGPDYPDWGRFWEVIDTHKVTIFYTAPTAIRAIAKEGNEYVAKHSLSSLRVLGTVGEPINPEAWLWYYDVIGKKRCPVIDTWWQTETGGFLIAPITGVTPLKPGSATLPFFGVIPAILDDSGNLVQGEGSGKLCIARSWPGQMRTIYGDHERFVQAYFGVYPGYYFSGDGCRRDKDGYYWITGRVDDVLNISGHRLGTAEIESALVLHKDVAEAAIVGVPDPIKGQAIYAFITVNTGIIATEDLKDALKSLVRVEIGPIAHISVIHWAPGLPKTRSGKIMRRILRKIAEGNTEELGDISTLADPTVVHDLIQSRPSLK